MISAPQPPCTLAPPLTTTVEIIRRDFPILSREVYGRPLVYLDNAATSQKPESVITAMDGYYRHYNANVHRGIHRLSEEATAAYEEAHRKAAEFIHARSFREIVFVKNATEALNLVAYSWGRSHVSAGDVIVLTEMEHHSNLLPWQRLATERGARLEFIRVDENGLLNLEDLERFLTDGGVKVVGVTWMSNVLGTINPVRKIADLTHRANARLVVDGAQGAPHLPVDVQKMDCDFLAFSGHKMLGPTGIGVLYGKRELMEEMEPFMVGGGMIREVTLQSATWNDLPWKFEAGTPNIAEGIGLAAAIDYLGKVEARLEGRGERTEDRGQRAEDRGQKTEDRDPLERDSKPSDFCLLTSPLPKGMDWIQRHEGTRSQEPETRNQELSKGMDWIRLHERGLTAYAMDRLKEMKGVNLYGPPAELRGGLVAFNLQGVHPHDLATILDQEGIAIRAGHHCAQPLHRKLGLTATARASFYLYNLNEEVDRLLEGLEKARGIFARSSGHRT